MIHDMKHTVVQWAAEYNELAAKGGDMWDELKTMGERMKLLRDSIDHAAPNSYDEIALMFGGTLDIDL
jgi:hypothetical protein